MSSTLSTTNHSLLDGYRGLDGVYDELRDATGTLRPQWQRFCDLVGRLGPAEFSRRWDQAQSLLRENGIAFSAYGDPDDKPRPWELDPLPVLLPAAQWQQLGRGLIQRARLLNLVLADLYGPQRLLADGLLPAELLYRHPGFHRALHGQRPAGGRFLHVYAADLARAADGRWWLLADRTESPSGVGYALENRIVVSRMLPEVFHPCQVERLAPYFIALRQTLAALASPGRDDPRMVLLSEGAGGRNYFEDAYVARYLGYGLVESGDLAVRREQTMLKTLGGLLPVDVIVRRPNTEDCDPLELAGDGAAGVTGWTQSVRSRRVAVVNLLGAGLVESPAFLAFLPQLCRRLLGEELLLPNVATWWCGDPQQRQYVLAHLDQLTIRPAFRRRGRQLETKLRLSHLTPAELAAAIRADGGALVAQQFVERSTAPVWSPAGLSAGHIAVRSYLVASRDEYVVMQGGLSRVSTTSRPLDLTAPFGEGSKDTWIVSDQPVPQISLLPLSSQAVRLRRSGAELPSRVADNLFWLGRQAERAEAGARLLRTTVARMASELDAGMIPELPTLLRALVEQGQLEPGYVVEGMRAPLPQIEAALPATVLDEQQPGSLRSIISQLFRTSSRVRDRLSLDSWRIVRRIDQQFRPARHRPDLDLSGLLQILDDVLIDLAALSGLIMESMTRTLGWRFLDLGRRLERALQVIGLTCSVLGHDGDPGGQVLEAILEVADSLMTYRSRYLANLQVAAVVDLLLTDETNPRSLAYQLMLLVEHVERLPRDQSQPLLSPEQRLALSLRHDIRTVDGSLLLVWQSQAQRDQLQQLLRSMEERLPKLSEAVSHRYLVHAGPIGQLAAIPWE